MQKTKLKPFIKWVGGKTSILPILEKKIEGLQIENYVEPFLGGGALFIHLLGTRKNVRYHLNDMNKYLIQTYEEVFKDANLLKLTLRSIKDIYDNTPSKEEIYYSLRKLFNTKAGAPAYFIFINKVGFNGLYRVNKKGECNTPWGKKSTFNYDPENLDALSLAADDNRIMFYNKDFLSMLDIEYKPNTLFYLDPPYAPTSKSKNYSSYTEGGFNWEDQGRVLEFCNTVDKIGHNFILSNSIVMKEIIEERYPHFKIEVIENKRMVSGLKQGRERVEEILVSNF